MVGKRAVEHLRGFSSGVGFSVVDVAGKQASEHLKGFSSGVMGEWSEVEVCIIMLLANLVKSIFRCPLSAFAAQAAVPTPWQELRIAALVSLGS